MKNVVLKCQCLSEKEKKRKIYPEELINFKIYSFIHLCFIAQSIDLSYCCIII